LAERDERELDRVRIDPVLLQPFEDTEVRNGVGCVDGDCFADEVAGTRDRLPRAATSAEEASFGSYIASAATTLTGAPLDLSDAAAPTWVAMNCTSPDSSAATICDGSLRIVSVASIPCLRNMPRCFAYIDWPTGSAGSMAIFTGVSCATPPADADASTATRANAQARAAQPLISPLHRPAT
jgi:hypothetical protein